MFKLIKGKIASAWRSVRVWFVGLMVALGIAVSALSVTQNFTWTNATTYSDGSSMPASEIAETRLYCDGSQVAVVTDGSESVDADLTPGTYDCHATHVDVFGNESVPSNTISVTVIRPNPSPPVLDEVT